MNEPKAPYSFSCDLATLPEGETEVRLEPSAEARAAIASWAGVAQVESLAAAIRLARAGENSYSYQGHFEADVVQSCVVTLEPVRSHISADMERHFRVAAARKRRERRSEEPEIEDEEDEETDMLTSPVLDLAAPLLEELALSIDPYPRAPGVVFAAPVDEGGAEESPFAVLERLKTAPAEKTKAAKRR